MKAQVSSKFAWNRSHDSNLDQRTKLPCSEQLLFDSLRPTVRQLVRTSPKFTPIAIESGSLLSKNALRKKKTSS